MHNKEKEHFLLLGDKSFKNWLAPADSYEKWMSFFSPWGFPGTKAFVFCPQTQKGQRSDAAPQHLSEAEKDSTLCSMTLRHSRCLHKRLLELRSSGLMMVTRKGGWRALIRTLLMQWGSQQASFRVTAHLKIWRLSLPLPLPLSLFLSLFSLALQALPICLSCIH